ncbi:MAG TPA: hypothetical protein VFI16_10645 [Anaeromyxobacteraceae bacterium]|nr:hypothetical protein [Anaeromyxobacteraceae bacterium]
MALAAGLALAACARQHRVAAPGRPVAAGPAVAGAQPARRGLATRIALLPPVNASGQPVTLREVLAVVEAELRARGLALASGDAVYEMLARHRLRYTGGVDGVMARAAREELGADALLVTAVTLHGREGSHGFGLSMRLVSAEDVPALLWMDETARTLDDAPGLFDLGIVRSLEDLMRGATTRLAGSLVAALGGAGPAIGTCPAAGRFAPRVRYRAAAAAPAAPLAVAVLPFVNETRRLDAGELLGLAFVRELARHDGVRVFEPGVVRAELLQHRVVLEGGVSHETARIALGAFEADAVVTGVVRTHDEYPVPRLEFSVLALETRTNRVLWASTSYNRGDDGVFFFDLGRVSTTPGLACRMVRQVVEGMVAAWAAAGRAPAPAAAMGDDPGQPGAGSERRARPARGALE